MKRRINAKQGFRSFHEAWRAIQGYEAMHMIRKGQVQLSVAARNGAILAGWKGPPVWLRNGLWGVTRSPAFRFGLPYGNSGCPSATAPFSPRAAGVLYDLRSACLCQQKSLSGLLGLAESGEYSLSQTKSASLFPARMGLPAVNHIAARARLCDRASGWAPLTAIERWRCGPPGPAKVAPSPAATNKYSGTLGKTANCQVVSL